MTTRRDSLFTEMGRALVRSSVQFLDLVRCKAWKNQEELSKAVSSESHKFKEEDQAWMGWD